MQTAIYTLMATLLFGPGHESIFILADAKKEIYYVVDQPSREKEIYDILKSFNDEQKAFNKGKKERTKGLRLLFTDRNATREDLLPLYIDSQEERKILRNDYIRDRLQVQDMLSPEEWNEIVRLSYQDFEKSRAGHDLEYARARLLNYKPLLNTRRSIEKNVQDPMRREECLKALEEYKGRLVKALDEIDDQMLRDVETLKNQTVSETEMRDIAARLAQFRLDVFRATLEFRSAILSRSTPEEWPALARAMVKLV